MYINYLRLYRSMPRVRVYHATDSKHLTSFLSQGARKDKSSGHSADQGSGFYVYTQRGFAQNHAVDFRTKEGLPTLLSMEADVNSDDWDIDYEANANLAIDFLARNPELIKSIPDQEIEHNERKLLTSRTKVAQVKGFPYQSITLCYDVDGKGRLASKCYWTG